MRIAAAQMSSGDSKDENLSVALRLIDEAAAQDAELVVLPEYVTYLGPKSRYSKEAESVPGPTSALLSAKAREHGMFIHGGSLIERAPQEGKFYNTSYLLDPAGTIRAVYRKVHLFDVSVWGEVEERESDYICGGDELVTVDLPSLILGMSICFDLRFPDVYRSLACAGASVFAVPAGFAQATGRVHWEILLRARAIENHAYVVAAGQDGLCGGYTMHGHSMIVDPWGLVLAEAQPGEGVIVADVDEAEPVRRRSQVPVLANRRPAVYRRVVRANLQNGPDGRSTQP